jgi:hypothetical protein
MAERFADACVATVADPSLRDLPLIGEGRVGGEAPGL